MSSSSNEYEHDHLQYDDGFGNEKQSPWYPTFGQPLLYYSQVEPFRNWQWFREPENDKPNCFKKAFRWYTQERVPFKNGNMVSSSNMNKAHLKGFAAWLDEKYNEFLKAGQIEGTKYILTQTSTIDLDKNAFSDQSENPPKKRYKRVKSAWKKRTKYLNTKEKRDVIMKAKVRACCNRSNNNAQYATTVHGVTKPRSRSLTSVVKEEEVHVMPFDIPDYDARNEGLTLQKREIGTDPSLKDPKNKPDRREGRHPSKNISCQCSKYTHEGIDACSQFEDSETKTPKPCYYKLNKAEIILSPLVYHNIEKKEEVDTAGISAQSKITPDYAVQKDVTITARIERNRSSKFVLVDANVQTSEHSINLNEYLCPEHYKYPLFMKIVRADKFKEN